MASPEQNALLAMQLFGAPAAQYNAQNDARTNLLYRLTMAQREEELKRELAGFQADREDSRQLGMERRQKTQLDAMQIREDTRVTEAERRQTAALDAREKQQITAEMNRLYLQYAQAAARAGDKIKQRSEFPETNEGLGQLAADLQATAASFEERQKKAAAMSIVGGLDEITTAVTGVKSRIAELSMPQPEEQKQARTMAIKALETSLTNKELASAVKLTKKAIADGLAALRRGEDSIARKLLGDEAIATFEEAADQVLFSLPNRKSALAEQQRLNQQLLQLQSQAARVGSDVTKAAGANLYLADELATRRSALQSVMTPIEPQKKPRSLNEIFPTPEGGIIAPAPVVPVVRPALVGAAGIGAPPTNLMSLMQSAPQTPIVEAPAESPDRAPYSFGQEIRNMVGLSPLTREGYAFDLQKLNDQLQYQNERGRATTLSQLQKLLIQAQTDPALAPQN